MQYIYIYILFDIIYIHNNYIYIIIYIYVYNYIYISVILLEILVGAQGNVTVLQFQISVQGFCLKTSQNLTFSEAPKLK